MKKGIRIIVLSLLVFLPSRADAENPSIFRNIGESRVVEHLPDTDGSGAFDLQRSELPEGDDAASIRSRQLLTSDDVRLRFLERGEGSPIILVAGWTMPAEVWNVQLGELSGDARIIAFDPRGQGESESPNSGYTLERRAQDLAELIEQQNFNDVILVGWSLGCFDVLGYPEHHGSSRVAAVVLLDGEIMAGTTIERARSFVGVAIATNYLFLDMTKTVAELERPLFYLVTPQLREQAKLVDTIKPDAVVRVFEGSGHAIFVDEATEVNRLLRRMLASTTERRSRPTLHGSPTDR